MSQDARRLRRERRQWAHPGSNHDRLVKGALAVLPIGIGVLAAFLVMSPVFLGGDVSFILDKNRVDVASERLRIESATYRGQDSRGRPFTLNAGSAVQQSSAEPVVRLQDLSARIELEDGPAEIRADSGRYRMDTQQVSIDGPVAVKTADGYNLETHDATIDLKTRTLESGGAVSGSTPMGSFSADKLSADLEGHTVSLSGNAHLRIAPNRANRQQ
ncbi:LPS export ABC transporter periplasmic protein LptC [Stakelama tenebrarum]|uniref:LPS export ABC transporter periplasmic protein LptC n=1 Tax=Stakelama tenebrarum TaxID=2711215 RepID=A0A6G6Y0G4_9SPHN|nr:LPS export ABC transporter periplasmic protein LptC [Sphingosinithalassobacter tenebrarum]QIG78434.1 LPS export ABC transporter periplasmic protein LptC [Sphingosinithalassobacter tenebrarum]